MKKLMISFCVLFSFATAVNAQTSLDSLVIKISNAPADVHGIKKINYQHESLPYDLCAYYDPSKGYFLCIKDDKSSEVKLPTDKKARVEYNPLIEEVVHNLKLENWVAVNW